VDYEEALRFSTRLRRRRVVVLFSALLVIAIVAVVAWRTVRARRIHGAEIAYASLYKCLLGPPLEDRENASGRLRRIALGDPPASWPARCTRYSDRLYFAVRELGESGEYVPRRLRLSDIASASDHFSFDWFFRTELRVEPPADVEAAPPAVMVPDERTPPIVAHGSLIGASTGPVPGGDLRLLTGDDPGELCIARAPITSFACALASYPSSSSHHVLWPGTEDGGPALHSGITSEWAYRPIDRLGPGGGSFCTKTRDSPQGCTAFGQRDGTTLVVYRSERGNGHYAYAVARGKDSEGPTVDLKMTLDGAPPVLYGDVLFWTRGPADGATHLMSRRLPPDDPTASAILDLGTTPGEPHGACYTHDALVVHGGMYGESSFVVFLRGGRPSPLHSFALADPLGPDEHHYVACGTDDVIFTDVVSVTNTRDPIVHVTRCTEAGCAARRTVDLGALLKGHEPGEHPDKDEDVRAVGLAGKLLVVWRSADLGIRFRLADPAEMDRAPDRVAYDDRLVDGAASISGVSQVLGFRLVSRHDAAVLLLQTMDTRTQGIKAVRIAPDGSVLALKQQ